MHWSDIDPWPGSPKVLAAREAVLRAAHRAPASSRIGYLVSVAEGKSVLNCGAVGRSRRDGKPNLNRAHRAIAEAASSCVAFDINQDGVTILSAEGYDIRLASVTDPNLSSIVGDGYDVMIAGELIEHIEEPGAMLEAARTVLNPGGVLVLTTPNPYCARLILDHVRQRVRENADHINYYFPSGIAELADRHGWELTAYRGATSDKHRSKVRSFGSAILGRIFSPDIACWTYIYELRVTSG